MLFRKTSIPLYSNNSFAIQQKSHFNRSKSHLNSPFMDFFPLRKIMLFWSRAFLHTMNAQNKHSHLAFHHPFPLWDRMILSKRDILLLHLNNLQTVSCQNKGALFCASSSCVFKKKLFLWSCQCKITERHNPRRWAAILPIANWNLTSDTML